MNDLVYHRHLLPSIERHASADCVVERDRRVTFAEHGERVLRLVDAVRRACPDRERRRVAVLADNGHRYVELHHAALLGAGPIVPLNTRLTPDDLVGTVDDAEPALLVADDHHAEVALDVVARSTCSPVAIAGTGQYDELVASGDAVIPAEPDEDDLAVLMYTGGTTGRPKAAMLTHRAEVLNAYHVDRVLDFGRHRRHLHQVPMFHAAAIGQILAVPMNGGCSVVLPRFEPQAVLDAVEREAVDQTVMVPSSIAMLLDHPSFDPARLTTLRDLVYGASPMPSALLQRVRAVLPRVRLHQGYGMTESAQAVTVLGDDDHRDGGPRLRSAGRPVPGVEVSIRDEEGQPIDPGEVGEVWARGGNFFSGYWRRPEETATALIDGWFRSGDIGRVDDGGYLFLLDRAKDMIKTGGENVYSVEVEEALASHPAVAQVAVIGVPDPTWGERVHAVVTRRAGATPTKDELTAHARRTIAGFKVPRSVEIRDEPLPLSGAGKVLKRSLRDENVAHT